MECNVNKADRVTILPDRKVAIISRYFKKINREFTNKGKEEMERQHASLSIIRQR